MNKVRLTIKQRLLIGFTCAASAIPGSAQVTPPSPRQPYTAYQAIEACLNRYNLLSTFRDSSGKVTDQTIADFEALFESSANIPNDLTPETPFALNVRDYVTLVYHRMDSTGIDTYLTHFEFPCIRMEECPCERDTLEQEPVVTCKIAATKMILNGLNEKWQPIYWDEPRSIPVIIAIRHYTKRQNTYILKIQIDDTK